MRGPVDGATADWPGWPLLLHGGELGDIAELLRVVVARLRPLHDLLQRPAVAPGPGGLAEDIRRRQRARDDAAALEGLAGTLWTLAAPRRLLIVRNDHGDADPLAFYVHDGLRLVRFLLSEEDCLVGEWQSTAAFHQALTASLGAPEAATAAVERVGDRFLRALAALLDAGLGPSGDGVTTVDGARSVIAQTLVSGADATQALDALVADGVLTVGGNEVRLREDWRTRCDFLFEPPSLVVHAIDLVDARNGRWRPTVLAVLGQTHRRICVLPPHGDGPLTDVMLELPPLTVGTLGDGVAALLEPPLTPPTAPVASYAGSAADWLAEGGAVAGSDGGAAWGKALPEQFAEAAGEPAVGTVLRPAATIELLEVAAGTANAQASVLALGPEQATEWTTEGSIIRWRALDACDLVDRLSSAVGVAPADPDVPGTVALDEAQAVRLMAGDLPDVSALPAGLAEATLDREARWCSVRARVLTGTVMTGAVLLLLHSPSHGLWRFEPGPGGFHVRRVGTAEVLAEVRDALTPPEAAPALHGGLH